MNRVTGMAILAASGAGFPLTQGAIARLGRPGAALVAGVTGGLLVRDVALLAMGTHRRLQPGPAAMLWAETASAAVATAAGLLLLRDPDVADARRWDWSVPPAELVRRIAVGALFGLHTLRFRVFLASASGLREPQGLPRAAGGGSPSSRPVAGMGGSPSLAWGRGRGAGVGAGGQAD